MNKFVRGDVVSDGTRVGTVVDSFYWEDSDDGTKNPPGVDMLPVYWDDGTQGFRHVSTLQYA